MSRLQKLRSWRTLPEASGYLSSQLQELVVSEDILRLALDGHLTLSVNFVNMTRAKHGKIISVDEVPKTELTTWWWNSLEEIRMKHNPSRPPTSKFQIEGERINDDEVILLEDRIVSIDGIWDLMMIASEKLDVEHLYQQMTGGPEVKLTILAGTFVEKWDGETREICQLQDILIKDIEKIDYSAPDSYYPVGSLPEDSVFVVRADALEEFLHTMNELESPTHSPHSHNSADKLHHDPDLQAAANKIGATLKDKNNGRAPTKDKVTKHLMKEHPDLVGTLDAVTVIRRIRAEWK